MNIPAWADQQLSSQLPTLRTAGEGHESEFKEAFPPQGHELGKDIAALATSGGGRVLIGVADNGELVGLAAEDGAERDAHVRRTQGVVSQVKPVVKAKFLLADEGGRFVLCIDIPKQDEPVFYYDHRPYVRDGTVSRPATPDEVKNLIWGHPSSEYKRQAEQLQLRQLEGIVQMNENFQKASDEQRRLANKRIYGG